MYILLSLIQQLLSFHRHKTDKNVLSVWSSTWREIQTLRRNMLSNVSQYIYVVHTEFNRLSSFSSLQYVEEFQTEIEQVELFISLWCNKITIKTAVLVKHCMLLNGWSVFITYDMNPSDFITPCVTTALGVANRLMVQEEYSHTRGCKICFQMRLGESHFLISSQYCN